MTGSNHSVATTQQLLGQGVRELRGKNRRIENLRAAYNEPQNAKNLYNRSRLDNPGEKPSNKTYNPKYEYNWSELHTGAALLSSKTYNAKGERDRHKLDTAGEILSSKVYNAKDGYNRARLATSAERILTEESRRIEKDERPTEIYFSPLSLNGSKVELSDPLRTPELTPTQASFNAIEAAWRAATPDEPEQRTSPSQRPRWLLQPEDLDRLVVALANAPMMQLHVENETWDSRQFAVTNRPSFISLHSTLREVRPKDSAMSLQGENAASPLSPGSPIDLTRATRVKFAGLAIVGLRADGQALRFWSHHHVNNGNLMHVGKNHYLNVPYDAPNNGDCRLRVETNASRSEKPGVSVFMQVTTPILKRKTGKQVYTLITEIDVTESFRKAAFIELVEQAGWGQDDVVLGAKDVRQGLPCESIDVVDTAVKMIAHADADTCAMRTLTLMSELERIKRKHRDFVIVRAHERSENGVPSQMSVPWLSEHLDETGTDAPELSSQATATFRLHMIDITAKRSMQSEPFTVKVPLAGKDKSVHFVPILDCESDKNVGWVCFLRDMNDVGL